jgi:hypothetical protein
MRPSWLAILGWSVLAAFIGFIAGSVLGLMWSNGQIHTTRTGYVLRGEHRGIAVIGDAILSGLIIAVIAAASTVVGLFIWRKRQSKRDRELDRQGDAT